MSMDEKKSPRADKSANIKTTNVETANNNTANVTPFRKPVQCPNCSNKSSNKTYPFCSKRCADIDMGRWFDGTYTIDT